MAEYVRIPKEHFDDLVDVWDKIAATMVIQDGDDPGPVPKMTNVLWIDPKNGHDTNDGKSAGSSFASWARLFQLIEPGTMVMLRPGIYRQPIELANAGTSRELPIYFKAEVDGTAIFDNMLTQADAMKWKLRGNGVYEFTGDASKVDPWCGSAMGTFIPRYKSRADLERGKIGDVRMPKYGFAKDGDGLYLLLPGKTNPSEVPVSLTKTFGTTFIRVENSPYMIFSGIVFRGHGSGTAISCDENSHHCWIQNCVSEHGRTGFKLSDDSHVHWNQYGYPGLAKFASDIAALNGGNMAAMFEYVKRYNHADDNKGNALLEGRLANSRADRSATGCFFSYNLCSECFDAQNLGEFANTSSFRDVAYKVYDDAYQFESWRKTHSSKNLIVDEALIVDAVVPFSHQDSIGQMQGPHKITQSIVLSDDQQINAPYMIKNMSSLDRKDPAVVEYNHCFFHNPGGPTSWGQNVNFLYLDHKKGRNIDLSIRNSIVWVDKIDDWDKTWNPNCDYNILVSPKDYPHIRGPNGMWFKTIDELHLVGVEFAPEHMDVRPTGLSPHLGKSSRGMTPGPFEVGDKWEHRKLKTQFTQDAPVFWWDR